MTSLLSLLEKKRKKGEGSLGEGPPYNTLAFVSLPLRKERREERGGKKQGKKKKATAFSSLPTSVFC